jgi:hypothetical protein
LILKQRQQQHSAAITKYLHTHRPGVIMQNVILLQINQRYRYQLSRAVHSVTSFLNNSPREQWKIESERKVNKEREEKNLFVPFSRGSRDRHWNMKKNVLPFAVSFCISK